MTTITLELIQELVANYMRSEGCSCCRGDSHDADGDALLQTIGIRPYEDASGYNYWYYTSEKKIERGETPLCPRS